MTFTTMLLGFAPKKKLSIEGAWYFIGGMFVLNGLSIVSSHNISHPIYANGFVSCK